MVRLPAGLAQDAFSALRQHAGFDVELNLAFRDVMAALRCNLQTALPLLRAEKRVKKRIEPCQQAFSRVDSRIQSAAWPKLKDKVEDETIVRAAERNERETSIRTLAPNNGLAFHFL
jgi:hypothetical protein